jgi:uncharacterized protein
MKSPQKRIENIDALRGFALAGIVLAHFSENYIGGPAPAVFDEAVHPGIVDNIADGLVFFFVRGKFFALFSFLFGLSFYIQMYRAEQKGINYSTRFLWRLILLFGIGYLHHLFYRGDILTVYAMAGIFLIPFYKVPVKWLLIISIPIFLAVFRLILFSITNGESVFYDVSLSPESEKVLAYYTMLAEGSLPEVIKSNAIAGFLMKMEFQFGIFSRGYLTFGFFVLGLAMGKIHLFENYEQHLKTIKKILRISAILILVFGVATVFFMPKQQDTIDLTNLNFNIGLSFYDLANLSMTVAIICLFFLIWRKKWGYTVLASFSSYGRMALTNYIMQTIIGTFILYGWGLGYIGEIRVVYILLMAFVLIFVQIQLSKWWLNKCYYGPVEWVWRCLTHLKLFPLFKYYS